MFEVNLTHFITSDAHNTTTPGNVLGDALEYAQDSFGIDKYYMFIESVNGRLVY